jgi:anti-sigma factor RsiW
MMRSTDCERIEELLSRYVAGDVDPGEAREISRHLEGCRSCADSLESYTKLESSLRSMPGILPDPGAVSSAVSARLGLRRKRSAAVIFRRLSLIWAAAATTLFIASALARYDIAPLLASGQRSISSVVFRPLEYWIESFTGWIDGALGALTSADPWLLVSISVAFSLLVFTAGTLAAFKALR